MLLERYDIFIVFLCATWAIPIDIFPRILILIQWMPLVKFTIAHNDYVTEVFELHDITVSIIARGVRYHSNLE